MSLSITYATIDWVENEKTQGQIGYCNLILNFFGIFRNNFYGIIYCEFHLNDLHAIKGRMRGNKNPDVHLVKRKKVHEFHFRSEIDLYFYFLFLCSFLEVSENFDNFDQNFYFDFPGTSLPFELIR